MNGTRPAKGPERVLVAGSTGYLGHHLVAQLNTDGFWVRALARRTGQAKTLKDADEVFIGEATRPETLRGVAEGVDTVYSTLGITRQRDGMTYQDVDYLGNLNILRQAEDAGVDRFVYISVLGGPELRRNVRLAEAKERFVDALTTSSIPSVVVRPTGYFSDMNAFLDMARRGTVYLFGDGQCRMNPISGVDLARTCVEAAGATASEIAVGGPEILTHGDRASCLCSVRHSATHSARPSAPGTNFRVGCRTPHTPTSLRVVAVRPRGHDQRHDRPHHRY